MDLKLLKKALGSFIILGSTLFMLFLILYLSAAVLSPKIGESKSVYPEDLIQKLETERNVTFDSNDLPTVQVHVDYDEATTAKWFPAKESPILANLVEQGILPPVEERVGTQPLVMEGVEGNGSYGGTWFRLANSAADVGTISWRLSGSTLVRWSPLGHPITPHVAKRWEVSDDRREWTFYLREGMRWSDGHPFTADDLLYWWDYEIPYGLSTIPRWMTVAGQAGELIKLDDYRIRFVFPEPYGTFLEVLASQRGFHAPRHYLMSYHPQLGDEEKIKQAMQHHGLHSPLSLYRDLTGFRNPDHPRIWPWIYRARQSGTTESFVRNPYFWAVDSAGQQLPYIDRIFFNIKSPALIPISAASGEASMQDRHIRYEDYTLLMENRERNGYSVYHWFPASRSVWSIWPNLNRMVTPDDPTSAAKATLLNEKTFRQALSLGINRQKVIDTLYHGYGEPAQIAPGRESPFHHEELLKSFTNYDPARANSLLDELGLTQRDRDNMRLFPDGTRMTWYIDFTNFTGEGPAQFIVDDWARIGIRAIQRERSLSLFGMEKNALMHDFTVWTGESEFNPIVQPRSFVAMHPSESHHGQLYGRWYSRGGLYAKEGEPFPYGKAPDISGPIRKGQELLEAVTNQPDSGKQIELFREILDIAAEEVWSISIATPPPQIVVVQDGFRNVPKNALYGAAYFTPANTGIETYFFDTPNNSPASIEQIQREIATITSATEWTSPQPQVAENPKLYRLIYHLVLGITVLLLLLAALRHPYIGRRLLIMVPTLGVISFAVFYIIQLPPGDFVETRIIQLQLTGDEAAIEEAENLREAFFLDDSVLKQYSRWVGLRWFFTFESSDKGLLQGHLGRSMETQRSVESVVGDRILLTVLVSLGTILFTWALAIPIGIYSAVRQYTVGDYIFSFIGFIGMCIPNFLLAIVMMYLSSEYLGINVTGLFSPEYAAAPEWSWGKVVDLLKHVWVPIVVIGTAGTAGMIRVMRGNLLDELGKPYVTTARAKGVRPFRLLMKYPVRLALNPFISSIGNLFPQLISGGAIVAIVLSLPMVGPVLLQGLMTQDIYLAGSMLMVLSLLGVFGTLVSDLMLMWLDPRIRMEGKGR